MQTLSGLKGGHRRRELAGGEVSDRDVLEHGPQRRPHRHPQRHERLTLTLVGELVRAHAAHGRPRSFQAADDVGHRDRLGRSGQQPPSVASSLAAQQSAVAEDVPADDPLQGRGGQVEVVGDGRQGDADHGDVQRIQEHRGTEHEQGAPQARAPMRMGIGDVERRGHDDEGTCTCIECKCI